VLGYKEMKYTIRFQLIISLKIAHNPKTTIKIRYLENNFYIENCVYYLDKY